MEVVCVGSLLVIGSLFDIRKQVLPLWLLGAYGILAILQIILSGAAFQCESYLGILPGIGILLIGKVTEESIGYGDGILLMITGLLMGIYRNLSLLFLSLFLMSFFSIGYLIFGKGKKSDAIPFVPFLAFAYVLLVLIKRQ